jgi:hypothetical protein
MFIETKVAKNRIKKYCLNRGIQPRKDVVLFVFKSYVRTWQDNPDLGLLEYLQKAHFELFPPETERQVRIPKNL